MPKTVKGESRGRTSKKPTRESLSSLRPTMPVWEFTLLYPGSLYDYSDEDINALYEAGCSDATVSSSGETIRISFHREAPNFRAALLSAIHDVEKSGVKLELARVEPNDD